MNHLEFRKVHKIPDFKGDARSDMKITSAMIRDYDAPDSTDESTTVVNAVVEEVTVVEETQNLLDKYLKEPEKVQNNDEMFSLISVSLGSTIDNLMNYSVPLIEALKSRGTDTPTKVLFELDKAILNAKAVDHTKAENAHDLLILLAVRQAVFALCNKGR